MSQGSAEMSEVKCHKDISYLPASPPTQLQMFDFYWAQHSTSDSPPKLLCFVHGGAWRSEDKSDFSDLARTLVTKTGYAIAIPNYRLTHKNNALRHPAHSEDILAFLEFIVTWGGPSESIEASSYFDKTQIYPIGHSCSTHMLCSIFLDSSQITPSLTPSPSLLAAVKGIIMSEGIYDPGLLIRTFEDYAEWFIIPAFGKERPLEDFDVTRYLQRTASGDIRWLILHSAGDTLIDMAQSERASEHLKGSAIFIGDKLSRGHDDIFTEDAYIDVIWNFIQ